LIPLKCTSEVKTHLKIRQAVADVVHQKPVEGLGQVGSAIPGSQSGILALQEGRLVFHLLVDVLLIHDVLLRAIHHTDNAQLDGNDPAAKDIEKPWCLYCWC